jgi:hypothetical protein
VSVPDVAEVRPVSRWSLTWRVLATLALVVLLFNGSLRLEDKAWPFGPMSQYAFSPPADDTIEVTRVYALLADGQRVEVPLRVETAGISRAEIGAVSDGWTARNPTRSPPVELFLVADRTQLLRGRVQSKDLRTLTEWRVSR